jgi:hypothetical protein
VTGVKKMRGSNGARYSISRRGERRSQWGVAE